MDEIRLAQLATFQKKLSIESFLLALQALREGFPLGSAAMRRICPWVQFSSSVSSDIWSSMCTQIDQSLAIGDLVLYPGHELYPREFLSLEDPCFLLFGRGGAPWLSNRGFSIVGSREPSENALQWMEECLPPVMKRLSPIIVSGGARGVDQKSHLLALRLGLPTIALLPSGLNRIYPESLNSWTDEIQKHGGCLLTEYTHDTRMQKGHFIARNRLIAALGKATLIIEARERSGTLITARAALDRGLPILVVPSHPFDQKAKGGLSLLSDGAFLVRDHWDIQQLLEAEQRWLPSLVEKPIQAPQG